MPASKTTTGTKKASTSTKKTTTGTKKATTGTKKTTTAVKKTTATKATTGVKKTTTTAKKTAATGVKKSTATVSTKSGNGSVEARVNDLYKSYAGGDEHKFELLCENYLSNLLGRKGEVWPSDTKSHDKGIDVFGKVVDDYGYIEEVYFVSAKCKEKVGSREIDSLCGAMGKFSSKSFAKGKEYVDEDTKRIGMIMTTGYLTAPAKEAIISVKKANKITIIAKEGKDIVTDRKRYN